MGCPMLVSGEGNGLPYARAKLWQWVALCACRVMAMGCLGFSSSAGGLPALGQRFRVGHALTRHARYCGYHVMTCGHEQLVACRIVPERT